MEVREATHVAERLQMPNAENVLCFLDEQQRKQGMF